MSEGDGYGGGGGGTTTTTTTTTLPPFNPVDEFPVIFERGSDPANPCSQALEDYSGPEECHLSGISHFETTFTSVSANGAIYKINGRRAYRNKSWSSKQITHLWIYYDSLSCVWRLTYKGTKDSPIADQASPTEYFDSDGNSLGFYIPNLLIDETNRGVYLQGEYIFPSAGSSSPVGDWYASAAGSLNEQEADPLLICINGEAPDNTYEQISTSKDFSSFSSAQGMFKIVGDSNGESLLSYFEPTPTEEAFAQRRYVKVKLTPDGKLIYDSEGPYRKVLDVGEYVTFNMVNGKDSFLVKLEFREVGSAIMSLNMAGSTIDQKGVLPDDRTIGTSISMSDNKVYPKDKYIVEQDDAVDFALGFQGETHDPYNYSIFDGADISYIEGGWANVVINYKGFWNDTYRVITIKSATNTDPIDSHEEFCKFAGKKGAEKNGAIFNDDETFDKFELYINSKLNDFAGVKSYLIPNYVVTEKIEYAYATTKDCKDIGKIKSPSRNATGGEKAAKLASGKRTFLVTAVNWESFGQGCIVTKTYRLSGKNGWDKDIYES